MTKTRDSKKNSRKNSIGELFREEEHDVATLVNFNSTQGLQR